MEFSNNGNFPQYANQQTAQQAMFSNEMQEMPSNPNERDNFMKGPSSTKDVMENLKKQCFDRIKSKRKSILDARRRSNIQQIQGQLTQTKQKKMCTQINSEIAQDALMIDEIIRKEMHGINQLHGSGDIDQWSIEYDDIMKELNKYLVEQLMDDSKWDEELSQIREQNFTEMGYEMHMMANSEENSGKVFVCAICKMGYVHKLRPPIKSKAKTLEKPIIRLSCENQGCFDVQFEVEHGYNDKNINVEVLMNQLNGTVIDHDQQKIEKLNQMGSNQQICESQRDLKVKIEEINDDFDQEMANDENEKNCTMNTRQKCFVIFCTKCDFTDFSPINL